MRRPTVEDSSQADNLVLEITDAESEDISPAYLGFALRILTRLMIRAHHAEADRAANVSFRPGSSALTVVPGPRPHDGDEAA